MTVGLEDGIGDSRLHNAMETAYFLLEKGGISDNSKFKAFFPLKLDPTRKKKMEIETGRRGNSGSENWLGRISRRKGIIENRSRPQGNWI